MDNPKKSSAGVILFTVSVGQFMVPLMLTAVGVALPSMGRELGASAQQLGLVEQLYTLALAMTMLTFGRLGDLVGRLHVFLAGMILFTVMTASLGFVQSVGMLLGQRFVQGIGAAILLSGSMALVATAYPTEVRGRAIGIVSAFTYMGLSVGPVLGGFITSHLGWRYVFWIAVPLGALGCALCLTRLRSDKPEARQGEAMDWLGSLVYAVGTALFMLGAAHVGDGALGPWAMAAGAALVILFIVLEGRVKSPLLDVSLLFKNRFFSLSCFAALGNYAATFGTTFFMSLYLQYVMGLSPHHAGLMLLLQPLMQVLVSPMIGRYTDKVGPGRLANIGIAIVFAGLMLAAATIGMHTPLPLIGAELALLGIGVGVFVTPNSTAIMGSVEKRHFGVASGMIGTMRTLGMVSSMTTVTLIFSLLMGGAPVSADTLPGFLGSMRVGLAAFAVFSCLGALSSLGRGRRR